jgi:hypothetical protein
MTICYLNNIYLFFLPTHTSHVLQPLDLGCFSSLKTKYRRQVGDYTALTDETRVGKAKFLEFYTKVHQIGLSKANIQSGWKATRLYPRNIDKPLHSCWVVIPKPKIDSQPSTSNISTLRRGRDLIHLLAKKSKSPASRISVRKAARALDKIAIKVALRDREIERLKALLDQANPPKRRKIAPNPNDRFINLAQILAQANQEPEQRIRKKRDAIPEVILEDEEGSSESEDLGPVRRTGRDRRPTQRYLERDTSAKCNSWRAGGQQEGLQYSRKVA